MKERTAPQYIYQPPKPALIVNERAWLECGCHAWVGLRTDNQECAISAGACSDDHLPLIKHFLMLLAESTVEPTDDPAVDVCERLLEEAARHYQS